MLEAPYRRPILSVSDVQVLTGNSFAAANQLVSRIVDIGILREITGYARHRRFSYEPYVRLFTDGGGVEQ